MQWELDMDLRQRPLRAYAIAAALVALLPTLVGGCLCRPQGHAAALPERSLSSLYAQMQVAEAELSALLVAERLTKRERKQRLCQVSARLCTLARKADEPDAYLRCQTAQDHCYMAGGRPTPTPKSGPSRSSQSSGQ